ncbi:NepR family anti-sigma factor [Devosia geojensis]|nr:NepR family anti-sigma factor [Devosia geojensis]
MIKDKMTVHRRGRLHSGRQDEGLGPNTDIGSRLRALYGSVQEEVVPDRLLELLEKLDSAEAAQRAADTE